MSLTLASLKGHFLKKLQTQIKFYLALCTVIYLFIYFHIYLFPSFIFMRFVFYVATLLLSSHIPLNVNKQALSFYSSSVYGVCPSD